MDIQQENIPEALWYNIARCRVYEQINFFYFIAKIIDMPSDLMIRAYKH